MSDFRIPSGVRSCNWDDFEDEYTAEVSSVGLPAAKRDALAALRELADRATA